MTIAGLVLAIVFIAVPALQRNARNTQRRADLGGLRAQVDTWTANNNGKIPKLPADLESIVGSTGWGFYNGNATSGEPTTKVIADNATVAAGNHAEHQILMITDNAATNSVHYLPNRQAIHVWLEKACPTGGILADGNDTDAPSRLKRM